MIRQTYLIQRLKRPRENKENIRWDSVFSFGGVKQGGFTDEQWDFINQLFSFDYMGSAEFEFGAVPQSLSRIFKSAEKKEIKTKTLKYKKPIYIIYHKQIEKYVESTINELISNDKAESQLKERCGLSNFLKENGHFNELICGWLEIDNDFMFFIDQEIYNRVCKMLNITPD